VRRSYKMILRLLIVSTLLVSLWGSGCQRAPGLDDRLNEIVKPYRFSIVGWSLNKLLRGDSLLIDSQDWAPADPAATGLVFRYFELVAEIRSLQGEINMLAAGANWQALATREEELQRLQRRKEALRDTVEWIIARQVRQVLNDEGIFNPADRYICLGLGFPPINFELDRLPHLLVVSPRDRIERLREIMLVQDIDLQTAEGIEAQVDALGVSSLVLEIGGFGGTFPTFVADDVTLSWTITTAAEEWFHQYLAFTPLGFAYVLDSLGISRNYEVAILNETLAGIVSDEIGALVLQKYYSWHPSAQPPPGEQWSPPGEAPFDFNRAMRELRVAVDELLARGQIEEAEQLMEERRQYLASQGYYIRKLNQAYFAFYGTYAYEPTSVDPIGEQMKQLRNASPSLSAFVNTASVLTSRQDLRQQLEQSLTE